MSEQTHRQRISVDHPGTGRVNQPGREEAVVRADSHPVAHERPEEWGWHGETGRWGRIGAVIVTLFMLSYLIGNHEGRVEDLWVVGTAAVMVLILVLDWRRRRNAWRAK
ncbi:DUF2631 domain-containing protein [Geodermatophilus poikilotrophus]|uniref:DUF2631 domain-containing protein n=1 Tax=Geodermatophilus poikilotrophus TaxID=1333667 RepID=A0A1I0G799_9ACTN|nr:DUF2631 domain-containing protein [Geodermatophilus poikilotrophus]SET65814.1 Protein of unknown function [Geodermatophilus poikilotrophus]